MNLKRFSVGILTSFFVFTLLNVAYAKIDLKDCVGIWLFDEAGGDTATDLSDNKNNGTIVNSPKWVDGKFGKALSFDGTDDYINLPAITSDNWAGLTLMAWAWLNLLPPELPSSYGEILGSKQDLYDLYEDKGNNELRMKVTTSGGAERPGIPTARLKTKQWIHIAGVYDGSAGKVHIYMNGELVDTHNLSGFISGTQYSSIGAQGGPNGPFTDFLNGMLDEVALFKTALTEQEIRTIMDKGLKNVLGFTAVVSPTKATTTWAAIKSR